jgi:hypothetical protein
MNPRIETWHMQQVTAYKLLTEKDHIVLCEKINRFAKDGWSPRGDPISTNGHLSQVLVIDSAIALISEYRLVPISTGNIIKLLSQGYDLYGNAFFWRNEFYQAIVKPHS